MVVGRQLTVANVDCPAVNPSYCHGTAPEDGCVPVTVTLHVSASFTAVDDPSGYRTNLHSSSGSCVTNQFVSGTKLNVTGSVTIDGTTYQLSVPYPSIHHFEATLVRETNRTITNRN